MIIYLDFDGTVVEHCYPSIGKINPGSFDVIKKLIDARHTIILNSYRGDCNDGTLLQAINFINNNPYSGVRIEKFETTKIMPGDWVTPNFNMKTMFIDDISNGIPLRDGFHVGSKMIDWQELDKLFEENGIYILNL